MEQEHAKQLLSAERARIEQEFAALRGDQPLEGDQQVEPGDEGSEDMYFDELNQARQEQLNQELAALERAEARLAAGTYGLSVDSGQPIADERLEALPLSERTKEEDERYRHGS
jgi:DnaK suppressor protein